MTGQKLLYKIPGEILLTKFSHPEKDRSAINLNEPNIIVVKYIK
jgi:hypothetical protein